ncbi:putative HAD superfamily protein [Bacillus mesophilus]|uniref:Nucleotidase n=1 Tax=Bacillus mesophilus TaxID=1808955 RepID=A0A6M0Q5T7_9BACI|nr:hypothetical protein [Bacillus mesophilus]MBM7660819.1 putative HAD superfamily protein [Bacillus mesophilus]NEY71634.1 hypothetical protein [Bacillus mesophilus]
MQKRKLGIDIDGTITCPTSFIPYINKSFNLKLSLKDLTVYDLSSIIGISSSEFNTWMKANEPDIYSNAKMIDEHVMSVLNTWSTAHQLIYISARNNQYFDVTQTWFTQREVPFHHIELIGKHDKLDAVKRHGIEVFFEDKHDNACEISEECNIPVILFNTPYNQDPVPKNVYRMNSWQEAQIWVDRYFHDMK